MQTWHVGPVRIGVVRVKVLSLETVFLYGLSSAEYWVLSKLSKNPKCHSLVNLIQCGCVEKKLTKASVWKLVHAGKISMHAGAQHFQLTWDWEGDMCKQLSLLYWMNEYDYCIQLTMSMEMYWMNEYD